MADEIAARAYRSERGSQLAELRRELTAVTQSAAVLLWRIEHETTAGTSRALAAPQRPASSSPACPFTATSAASRWLSTWE